MKKDENEEVNVHRTREGGRKREEETGVDGKEEGEQEQEDSKRKGRSGRMRR